MKRIKEGFAFAFAILAIFVYFNKKNDFKDTPVFDSISETIEIVLLDQSKDCIPLSISVDNKDLCEQVQMMVDSMKVNTQIKKGFYGFLANETEINGCEVHDRTLTLDFNPSFYEIDPALEFKSFEALSYSFTQFDGIDFLYLCVDGEPIREFKSGQFKIIQPIDGSLGLNNFDTTDKTFHRSDEFKVVLEKKQGDETYQILKTIRTKQCKKESLENYFTKHDSIFIENHPVYKCFEITEEEMKVSVEMSSEILNEEKSCDMQKLKLILLTLKSNYKQEFFEIIVEGIKMGNFNRTEIKFNEI